jgi:hypothetical protein
LALLSQLLAFLINFELFAEVDEASKNHILGVMNYFDPFLENWWLEGSMIWGYWPSWLSWICLQVQVYSAGHILSQEGSSIWDFLAQW